MEKDVLMWVFGILISIIGFVIGLIIKSLNNIGRDYIETVQRLTKMEATIQYMGYVSAKAAHSPHNPELDSLLEKYYRQYEEKDYDLSDEDWSKLALLCQEILDDVNLPNGYRVSVGFVLALCKHKKMRY